jgi:hypothetical protein
MDKGAYARSIQFADNWFEQPGFAYFSFGLRIRLSKDQYVRSVFVLISES